MSRRQWIPSKEQIERTRLYKWMQTLGFDEYDTFHQASIKDIAWFWAEAEKALDIQWRRPYREALSLENGVAFPTWFVDGELNIVESAVEKWASDDATKHMKAISWEGENGETRCFTFFELREEVNRVAGGLQRQLSLKKGDVLALYLPMLPETVIVMLACAKLGVIITPIFSGYGPEAIASRLNASNARVLVTADGFYRRGKRIPMKTQADEALHLSPSVEHCVVVRRTKVNESWNPRDLDYERLRESSSRPETVSMSSSDELMLLYTSGTTGKPKAVVHTHSGFPLKAAFDAGLCMDVGTGDSLFWYTDMGWMMGPFLVYGGLINGATTVLFEGTPDYPSPKRLWEVAELHNATHLGVSPTLVRSLMQHGDAAIPERKLKALRVFASTGEPWNDEPWQWLFNEVGRQEIPIFNYTGGTEIGGGILGNLLIKPIGTSTFNGALPGMAADVYSEDAEKKRGEVGELVITKPWVGMTAGFWKERERYLNTYWRRIKEVWVHGDWAIVNEGLWQITGRSDDVLNIAGKRIGPAELETLLVDDERVSEAAVVGVPDAIKGEAAVAFVVTSKETNADDQLLLELQEHVGRKVGKALRPAEMFFVDELPKTRNAKVIRRAIRAAYLGEDCGDLSALENPQSLKQFQRRKA
ncbi:AMP-binding protein [Shouchella shacheensis]|uniref:AMP-binding protein n=1 Tax=Shouchella shacheensis TaxID=1649580 RepID=UPI00074011A9|nr:AMP-binding protein [Shouchella shacheensis]